MNSIIVYNYNPKFIILYFDNHFKNNCISYFELLQKYQKKDTIYINTTLNITEGNILAILNLIWKMLYLFYFFKWKKSGKSFISKYMKKDQDEKKPLCNKKKTVLFRNVKGEEPSLINVCRKLLFGLSVFTSVSFCNS